MSQRYIGGLIYNPPGGYSGYFDGTGDYISVPDSADFTMGSGDFTIQCWVYSTANSGSDQYILGQVTSGGAGSATSFQLYKKATSNVAEAYVYIGGSKVATSSATIPVGQWTHLAMVRDGGTMRLYVNGKQDGTNATLSTSSIVDSSGSFAVGRTGDYDGLYFSGYVSNVSVVKGTCLFPNGTSFTVPSGPLPTGQSGQSVLLCRASTFIDSNTATTAKTVTVGGNSVVSNQNPFPLTTLPNPALGNAGNGVYTMSQYLALKNQGLWPAYDPYFRYNTLLLHGNGTNGAQNNTFTDSSTNAFSITRNGNTTQGTFTPFSQTGWGNYFDGSSDYLSLSADAGWRFTSTTSFTVEMWLYVTSTNVGVISAYTASKGWVIGIGTDSGTGTFNVFDGSAWQAGYGPDIRNSWAHCVFTSNAGSAALFVNGTRTRTWTLPSAIDPGSNAPLYIGSYTSATSPWYVGYISNLRIVKGSYIYDPSSSTLTVPTAPLTDVTNTQLLTCQSNRFIDTNTQVSAKTITVNGNGVSVQAFSPFAPSAAYSASTNGGSGYVDGTGDYINFTDSSNLLDLGGKVASLEVWVYPTQNNAYSHFFGKNGTTWGWSTSNGIEYALAFNAGQFYMVYNDGGGSGASITDPTSGRPLNQWYWIVVASDASNNLALFVNGTRVVTGTNAITKPTTRTNIVIGANSTGTEAFGGYVCGHRFISGTGAYSPTSTTLTIPTAPPTAVTNTQLLLNYTNAGITDATAKNDLETVGNAQISTTQSKFGGSSMYFDGTGDWLLGYTNSPLFGFGTGDFTIEFWAWKSANGSAGYDGVVTVLDGATTKWYVELSSTQGFNFYNKSTTQTCANTTTTGINDSTWHHWAICRQGSTWYLFKDGVALTKNTDTIGSSSISGGTKIYIGNEEDVYSYPFNGYIDDLRITKGIARYTANFTPPTSLVQDQ